MSAAEVVGIILIVFGVLGFIGLCLWLLYAYLMAMNSDI